MDSQNNSLNKKVLLTPKQFLTDLKKKSRLSLKICLSDPMIYKNFLYFILYLAWYKLRIYIQGPDPGIEFLVDDLSLKEIPENLNWKTEANQRIDNIRKSNFTLR